MASPTTPDPPVVTTSPWLDTARAARYCGYGVGTLERYRISGAGPVYSRVGRRVLYHRDDLDQWLRLGLRRSTSGPLISGARERERDRERDGRPRHREI
jgi:hypothetical protein